MDMSEQLCYISCNFCTIVLAVSVPIGRLFDVVTVRCGNCTNLLTVNMANQPFPPTTCQLQVAPPPNNINSSTDHYKVDSGSSSSKRNTKNIIANKPEKRIVNRPPEKRQRVPSAYNQFIKEEIQRIKTNNPAITHREAFSTAAKNWAHFPHIHFGLMLEANNQARVFN